MSSGSLISFTLAASFSKEPLGGGVYAWRVAPPVYRGPAWSTILRVAIPVDSRHL